MAEIFISYAHEDQLFVRQVVTSLEAEGLSVWWDHAIPPGKTWDEVIARGIEEAKACIIIWSQHSIGSDWVKEEATLAKDGGKYLPVQIGGLQPPVGFRRIQAANLTNWTGDRNDPQWRMLAAEAVKLSQGRALSAAPARPATPSYAMASPAPATHEPAPKKNMLAPVIALGGVAAIGLFFLLKPASNSVSPPIAEQTSLRSSNSDAQQSSDQLEIEKLRRERQQALADADRAKEQAARSDKAAQTAQDETRQSAERQRLALLDAQRRNLPEPPKNDNLTGVWKFKSAVFGSSSHLEGTLSIEPLGANGYPCQIEVIQISDGKRTEATETCVATIASDGQVNIKSLKVTKYTGSSSWNPDSFKLSRSGNQLVGTTSDGVTTTGAVVTFSR